MSDEQEKATPPEKAAEDKQTPSQAEASIAPQAKAPAAEKPAAAKKPAAKKPMAKKPAAKKKGAAKKAKAPFERPQNISRREFLNLAWLGSMALLTVQTLGVSVLFLFPKFKVGDFGGIIPLPGPASAHLPALNGDPKPFSNGKFWLTNTDKGVYAIYKVCTHLGCLYAWADVTHQFECPCHGSKFTLTGKYIEGPAPTSLDRFKITATRPDGSVIETPANGAGLKELTGDETLVVDTSLRIKMPDKGEV